MNLSNHLTGITAIPPELRNVSLEARTSDPAAPASGRRLFYRTDTNEIVILGEGVRMGTVLGSTTPPPVSSTVGLGQFIYSLQESLNYRITADFGAYEFDDKFFQPVLTCNNDAVFITEELNAKTPGKASWLVYYRNPTYGVQTTSFTFVGSAKGFGWTGPSNILCSWTALAMT